MQAGRNRYGPETPAARRERRTEQDKIVVGDDVWRLAHFIVGVVRLAEPLYPCRFQFSVDGVRVFHSHIDPGSGPSRIVVSLQGEMQLDAVPLQDGKLVALQGGDEAEFLRSEER